jgi:hypothetical protein
MVRKAFDVERLKRNWDRAASAPHVSLPERIALVARARDPYPEAERLLERIRVLTRLEFSGQERQLQPFLSEAFALLAELRGATTTSEDGSSAALKGDPAELRSRLLKVLADLEDLYEVYSAIGCG